MLKARLVAASALALSGLLVTATVALACYGDNDGAAWYSPTETSRA